MAETLLSPADLADVMSTPEFNDLPFAERQSLVERGLQESSQWLQQDRGGWTPETWRQFGEAANAARQYVADSETLMEKTGSVLSKAGGAVKDALAIAGTQVAGISPLLPNGKGGVTFQVPGETSVPMLINRAGALTGGQVSALLNNPKPVREALDEIRAGLDEGAFFNAEGGFSGWLDTANAAVQDAAKAYHGDAALAEQNTLLTDPENAKLVAAYAATRDPAAWTALQKRLERTPLDFAVAADKQKLETQSKLGQAMTPEARSYIAEASDPAEVAGNLLGIGMGAKALSRGLSMTERAKAIGKGIAGEMASEQVSASIDDPRLSLAERLQVAKDSIIAAAGLTAAGATPGAIARTIEAFNQPASVTARTAPTPPADQTVPDAGNGAGSTPAAGAPVSPLPGIAQRAGTVDVPPLVPGLEAEDIGPLTAADVQDMETIGQGNNQMPQRQPILAGVPDRVAPPQDNQTVGQGDNLMPAPEVAAPDSQLDGLRTQEVPVSALRLSKDVPQFKSDADEETGVVEPLAGKYQRLGTGPILVWERLDGSREVISGRHRFDLAKRTGEQTIPAQVVREADGFTVQMAVTADAELNIRDGHGKTKDFANYFRASGTTDTEAESRGLLARAAGKTGWAIGTQGSQELFDLHQNGRLTDAQAAAVARTAPGNEALQRAGIAALNRGTPIDVTVNLMRALELQTGPAPTADQLDLFGADDSMMLRMEEQAKKATEIQRGLKEQVAAVQGAAKRPEQARKLGVNVKDPEGVRKRVDELKALLYRWESWPLHADLRVQVTGETPGVGQPMSEAPISPSPSLPVSLSSPTRTTTTAAATPPGTAPTATSGRGEVGSGGAGGAALLDVAPSTRPRNRGETAKPQREDVLAELGQATREGAANQAQGTLGFQNFTVDGTTAGFANRQILNEALDLVQQGFTTFANWSKAMVTRFGRGIKAHLEAIWERVKPAAAEMLMNYMRRTGSLKDLFAGEQANVPQFMRDSLQSAQAMAKAGESPEQIRAVTGWFPGKYDGKMRWEVPDEQVQWIGYKGRSLTLPVQENVAGFYASVPLGELIQHPALFEAYPEARSIVVTLKSYGNGGGVFRSAGNGGFITIDRAIAKPPIAVANNGPFAISQTEADEINAEELSNGNVRLLSPQETKSTLLHEIQHWIQEKEGFARGSSIERMGARRARAKALDNMLVDREKEILGMSAMQADEQAIKTGGIEAMDAIQAKLDADAEWSAIRNELNQFRRTGFMPSEEQYRRTAGEIEARDVQARQSLTAEQRKATAPYSSENISPEDAIVLFDSSGPQMSTGNAPAANETQARFASPDEAQRVINGPRADVDVAAEASAWLDSVSSEAAVDAFASRAVPLPLDAAEFAAATLISRLTMQGEQAKTEAGKLAAHVQAQRMARVWTKEYLSADPARALRQRGVVNNTILRPIAPVMAAQGILVDRADAVMNKRFDGGAGGVVEKVKAILEKADIDITERVEAILSAVMGSRLQPRVTLAQAVAGLVNGKTQRQQMIDDVARALMQRAKSREVKPGTQTALAALVASLKRTLGAAVKGEALKPETLKMGELLARTFVDQVAEAPLFEEAWKAGREQVRAMLIETGLSETQAEKRLNELMPATPTVAYAPGMVKQAVQRGFEQAGYGQTLTTRMDRSGQRQVDVRAEALRNPQKAMEAVMKVWDEEADAAGISPQAWAQGRALAWKALGETMQQWQAQQQATQAKADAAAKAKLLEKDGPALAKLLKSLKDKIAPGMSWADIFMDMPSSQRERQREIYRRLMFDERLKDLTMEQRLDLTNELDRAWQRERKAVFNRELEKAGILGEKDKGDRDKVKKALPKLLRMINLGMFNSEMWREIVAPEYGLKMLTAADTAQLRAMAEVAWKLPEGVIRNQKLRDLTNAIQKKTGASWVEVLNSYWTAAVLSGLRTQFDTWLAAVNGMGTNLMQIGSLIARGQGRAAIDAHAQWWRGLFEGVRESGQILFKGDTSYLKRFGADLKKALEGETSVTPVPLGENLWQNGNTFQKYGLAPVMMFTGRLMAAADHINNTATTQGAIAVARAMHPELYQGKVGFTAAERVNARVQALREVTGGREPQTSEERATVSARAREILNGSLQAEDYAAASEIGDIAAYQNDPTGLFGVLYSAMKQGLGSIQRGLNDYAQDVTANRFARVAAGVMAGSLHGVTGTRFMRFGANFGADMTRYIPGSYVLGKAGFYGREVSRAQQELLLGKNLVGLMLMSTLAAVFLNSDDDDEGWQIEGDWSTLNPQQVKKRMAAGLERMTLWKRENGQVRRVSYKQWPTMGLFSVAGGMLDEKRHKPAQFAQHGTAGHLLRGIATGYTQIKNVSAVRNLVELFGEPTFSADAVDGTIDKMIKTGTNFAGGFVPTLIKDADVWTDPRSFKPEGVAEMMLRNTPILRKYVNDGRPQLNLLGEEVKLQRAPWSRAYTNVQSAEAHRVLGALLARGLALPMPSDEVKLYQNGVKVPLETLGREAVWQYERAVGQGYKDWLSTDGAALLTLPVDQAEKAIQRRAETIKRQALGKVQR